MFLQFPDPSVIAVDSLSISSDALDNFAYCPIALLPKLVHAYTCPMIVVAPGLKGMSWFWDLIDLSTRPLLLPHWEHLLKQPFRQRFHQNLPYLTLHVLHLDSILNYLKNPQSAANRIKVHQRLSSRRVCESRWTIFEVWYKGSTRNLYKLQLVQTACTSCNLYRLTCTSCNMYKICTCIVHIIRCTSVF